MEKLFVECLAVNHYNPNSHEIHNQEYYTAYRSVIGYVKKIIIFCGDTNIEVPILYKAAFYPFFSLDKIVLLLLNQPKFPHPNNLVILSSCGSVSKIIEVPEITHPYALRAIKEYLDIHKKKNYQVNVIYYAIGSIKKIDSKDHLTIFISEPEIFNSPHPYYYEEKALNVDTGEWHPTYRVLHSPLENQGWGTTYE